MEYQFAQSLEEAEKIISEKEAVLIFFSDESCNVGDALAPKLQKMLKEKFPLIDFLEINVQLIPQARGKFNIFVIPSVLVYFDGRESIRMARHINISELENQLNRIYSLMFS